MRILIVVDYDDNGVVTNNRCFILSEEKEIEEIPKNLLSEMMNRFIVEHIKRISPKFKEKALC